MLAIGFWLYQALVPVGTVQGIILAVHLNIKQGFYNL